MVVRLSLATNPQHTFSCALPASELGVSSSHWIMQKRSRLNKWYLVSGS
jgi:hypothetical protein